MKIFPARLLAAALLFGASAAAAQKPAPSRAASAPTDHREQTADQQVQQVLNRLGFGPRPGDVAKVRAMGVDQWIALQLAPDRIEDSAADRVLASYEMLGKPTHDLVGMYEQGQVAIRQQQKAMAQQGDSNGKKDLR